MTMATGVNTIAFILFVVAWALYLISEAARTGAESKPQCDNSDDDKVAEKLCNGYAAAAVFFIFATVASLVAAGLATRSEVSKVMFVVSLAFAALSYTCEYGGLTTAVQEGGKDYYGDNYKDLQSGWGAATVFFFFAFLTAIACAVLVGKYFDRIWMGTLSFFVFLGLWALALVGSFGGSSKFNCDADSNDTVNTFCDGFAFSAFMATVAMISAFWFSFLVYKSREDLNKIWVGWFLFAIMLFIAYTSYFATNAQVYCQYDMDGNNDKQCDGYSAAAFFILVASLVAMAGLIFACREMSNMMHVAFMFSFSLFFLGYSSFLGGQSVYNCAQDKDNADAGGVDMGYDDKCDGYGAATFFCIVGFVLTVVGSYFAYQGGDEAGPHQQMSDQPYPSEGLPPTTVGHDDDYNKA